MATSKPKISAKAKTRSGTASLSRRGFLKGLGIGAGVLAVAGGAGTAGMRWLAGTAYRPRFLVQQQFEALEAACERILPADSDPGAQAIWAAIYIDRLLAEDSYTGDFRKYRSILTKGLDGLEAGSRAKHGKAFARLNERQQDALLGEGTDPQFLTALVDVTLDGVFYDPFYGGNRDGMGWRMVGFSTSASFRAKGLALPNGAAAPS
jgi:gluconate 2-dehydrogenase gamma chain